MSPPLKTPFIGQTRDTGIGRQRLTLEKSKLLKGKHSSLEESGQLRFIDAPEDAHRITTTLGFDAFVVNGHTDAQMCPILDYKGKTVVFMADLLPSTGHIPLPYVMGYDTRPLLTIDERQRIFTEAAEKGYHLFLEHDAYNEVCTLQMTDKGPRLLENGRLNHFIS